MLGIAATPVGDIPTDIGGMETYVGMLQTDVGGLEAHAGVFQTGVGNLETCAGLSRIRCGVIALSRTGFAPGLKVSTPF
jgi:hypothetical protein